MTQSSGFIAAIDFGTSKITGIIGRRNENNVISVLAYKSLASDNCIRRGTIYNIENAGAKVRGLINMLENSIEKKVGRVYVSLNGQSMHTEDVRERKQLSSSGIVTEEVVAQLRSAAEKYKPDFKRKYAIADVEYFIDDKPEKNPVGVTCNSIEADYKMVVGRPNLVANIEKVLKEKANIGIAGYITGSIASAEIALTAEEKELGCAFIDFGAGTTEVSVYKDGILRRMVVIPFGGKSITQDISKLNFPEAEAEVYKVKYGKARESAEKTDTNIFTSPFSSKPEIDFVELNKVILLRLNEITANIKEQIKLSGYMEQLGAGLIITGGASQLKNLDTYLQNQLNMTVRRASARKNMVNNVPELSNDPSFTLPLGLLLYGNEDCELPVVREENAEEEVIEQPVKDKNAGKRFGSLRDKVRNKKEKEKDSSGKNPFGRIFDNLFSDGTEDDE